MAIHDPDLRPTLDSGGLSSGYESARSRLALFSERLEGPCDYDLIWKWIDTWRQQLMADGKDLPAPWVFANEQNVVELEWESGSRFLWLRLDPNAPFRFSRVDSSSPTPLEEEGSVAPDQTKELLVWVVG